MSEATSRFEPFGECSLAELFDRLVGPTLEAAIERWLIEDFGDVGDITTEAFIAPDVEVRAEIRRDRSLLNDASLCLWLEAILESLSVAQ